MLVFMEFKEGRVRTLLARMKRLDKYQSKIVLSDVWADDGVPEGWLRAQKARRVIQDELGRIASIYVRDAA